MTNQYIRKRRIFIIEKYKAWREFSSKALKSAGYYVKEFDDYNHFGVIESNKPDLVIVSFARATQMEIELIKTLRRNGIHQLVLSSFLPWSEMRSLFLAGADDVAEKPFSSQDLLKTVNESFSSISIKEQNKLKEQEVW